MGRRLTTLLGSPSYTNLDYTAVKPRYPFNWEELEGSLVTVSAVGAGVGIAGAQAAHTSFDSSVYHYGPSGVPIRTAERLFEFDSAGKDWQFGVGASALAGPLVRVDN